MGAVGSQRERFELTRPAKLKAKECCDLVLLSLYVYIPPSRGLEVRSLEIVKDFSDLSPLKKSSDKNFLILSNDGEVRLQFNHYKTKRSRGRDELALKVSLHSSMSQCLHCSASIIFCFDCSKLHDKG